MKLLLMGPVGCGKGTIGELLSDYLHIPVISGGELLRELPSNHPRYKEVHDLMDIGEPAPKDLLGQLYSFRASKSDCLNGYVIDGWARNAIDLTYFDPGFDKVILLTISTETSVYRLGGRRTCKKCGKIFNVNTVPPKIPNVCDECGGELYQRDDDTEEAIRRRLEIYYSDTQEVIGTFKQRGILLEIDGEPSPKVVFEKVRKALNI